MGSTRNRVVSIERRDSRAREARDRLAERLEVLPRDLGALSYEVASVVLDGFDRLEGRLTHVEQSASIDELTGALRRGAGQQALSREIERARRMDDRLVVAFIDVDHLKAVNDSDGHAAGDRLLQELVATLRGRLRPYDLLIRWGGDEFVCALPQQAPRRSRERLTEIANQYSAQTGSHSFSFGVAGLRTTDDAEALLSRADADLMRKRSATSRRGHPRPGC
jgi:diguanylate cyclase (GGDEF)-like protein